MFISHELIHNSFLIWSIQHVFLNNIVTLDKQNVINYLYRYLNFNRYLNNFLPPNTSLGAHYWIWTLILTIFLTLLITSHILVYTLLDYWRSKRKIHLKTLIEPTPISLDLNIIFSFLEIILKLYYTYFNYILYRLQVVSYHFRFIFK